MGSASPLAMRALSRARVKDNGQTQVFGGGRSFCVHRMVIRRGDSPKKRHQWGPHMVFSEPQIGGTARGELVGAVQGGLKCQTSGEPACFCVIALTGRIGSDL